MRIIKRSIIEKNSLCGAEYFFTDAPQLHRVCIITARCHIDVRYFQEVYISICLNGIIHVDILSTFVNIGQSKRCELRPQIYSLISLRQVCIVQTI